MKPYKLTGMLHPSYMLIAGVVGGFIAFCIYILTYPVTNDPIGYKFVHAGAFTAWFFLQVILFSLITILIIPTWIVFSRLLQHVKNYREIPFQKIMFNLFINFVCLVATVVAFDFYSINYPGTTLNSLWPLGLTERFQIVYVYASLVFMPLAFGMTTINYVASAMLKQLQSISKDETKIIEFITEYLGMRRLLQIFLLAAGLILSMLPLTTAGLRKIMIEITVRTEANSPIESVIAYGVLFSALLILIYGPAYLNLMNVGRELHEILYPIHSLDDLKEIMAKREQLDLLLQTNIGITQNLKAGVVTMAPLVSALIISLLGIKIGP